MKLIVIESDWSEILLGSVNHSDNNWVIKGVGSFMTELMVFSLLQAKFEWVLFI